MRPWDIDATHHDMSVGQIRLHYLEWPGQGSPILLLHGITSNAATFWRLGPELAAAGYHIFALDMPGHGASDISTHHEIDHIATLVGAFIMTLGLEGLTLIGHSWGGATALALSSGDHPARNSLARVVLLDPALAMNADRGREGLPFYLEGVGQSATTNAAWLRERNPTWTEGDIIWKLDALARCHPKQVEGFFIGSDAWNLTERIAAVDVPLLLMLADPHYSVITPEQRGKVNAMLRHELGTIQTIYGVNHNMLRGNGYNPTVAMLMDWLGNGKVKGS